MSAVNELHAVSPRGTHCLVCGGSGWILAAPIEVVGVWTGADPTPQHQSRAAWEQAVPAPCPFCYPAHINVLA